MSAKSSTPQWGTFGALLRRWRAAADLTQEELAERLGYSTVYIAKLEQGTRRPGMHVVVEIAAYLNGDINEGLLAAAYAPIAAPTAVDLASALTMMQRWPATKLQTALALLRVLDDGETSQSPPPPAPSDH